MRAHCPLPTCQSQGALRVNNTLEALAPWMYHTSDATCTWPEIQDNMAIGIRNVLPHSLFKMADLYRLSIANICFSNFQRFLYINPSSAHRKHNLITRSFNRINFRTVQVGQTSSQELYSYLISSHIPDS